MCGILGYWTANNSTHPDLRAATNCLRHRGPDRSGHWQEKGVGLGHTRLAVIDLSVHGDQPMHSDDGSMVLVYNGEIYNFPTLRRELLESGETFRGHSDSEVMLKLFQRHGVDCLHKLHGMFSFAIWNKSSEELFIARDRLGEKPLFYSQGGNAFYFTSEIQSLFAMVPDLSRQANLEAIDLFFSLKYIPAPHTAFRAIKKLPPAHAMVVKGGKLQKLWSYWKIPPTAQTPMPYPEARDTIRQKVLESVRSRLISDVPLGAFLSGGVDSSIILAAMAQLGVSKVKTFSIGFTDWQYNELPFARQVADHFGSEHHEFVVQPDATQLLPDLIRHFGEPFADHSALASYYVARCARQTVTVALTGDGADELFAGYRRYYQVTRHMRLQQLGAFPLFRFFERLKHNCRSAISCRGIDQRRIQALYMSGLKRVLHQDAIFTDEARQNLLSKEFIAALPPDNMLQLLEDNWQEALAVGGSDLLNSLLAFDLKTSLPGDMLTKVDIAAMMNSLECRPPFLDHSLVEFSFSLPGKYKLHGNSYKCILKDAFADVLPSGVADRKKAGFAVPMAGWLKNELAPMLRERLLGDNTLKYWVNLPALERAVSLHLSGEQNHGKRLWPLLVLAEWLQQYKVHV